MVRDWFTREAANHQPFSTLFNGVDDMNVDAAKQLCRTDGTIVEFVELEPEQAPIALRLIYRDDDAPVSTWTSFFDDGIVVFGFPTSSDAVKFRLLIRP